MLKIKLDFVTSGSYSNRRLLFRQYILWEVRFIEINIGEMLANRAYLSPEMEGYSGADYRFSFKDANKRANRFAAFFKKSGLKSGDRIAVLCKNNKHATTALFGAAKIGIITLMLNWRLQLPELVYILNDSETSLLLYESEFAPVAERLRAQTSIKTFLAVEPGNKANNFEKRLPGKSTPNRPTRDSMLIRPY